MAMLGEQFMVGEEICGAVISIRYAVSIFLISLYLTNFFLSRKAKFVLSVMMSCKSPTD